MKDKWMNLGCEEDELKPYVEPEQDFKEPKRIGMFLIIYNIKKKLLIIRIICVICHMSYFFVLISLTLILIKLYCFSLSCYGNIGWYGL